MESVEETSKTINSFLTDRYPMELNSQSSESHAINAGAFQSSFIGSTQSTLYKLSA